jgi:UDP-3-O-[3-hydroxymyristoyl] glucosamine N-acyltransferase
VASDQPKDSQTRDSAGTDQPSLTAGEIASLAGGRLDGPSDLVIRGLDTVDAAGPDELTFIGDASYAGRWASSRAGAALVTEGLEPDGHDPATRALIYVESADLAMGAILDHLAPELPGPAPGVHETAFVDPTATIGADCRIGPRVCIGPRTVVGDRAVIHAGVSIFDDVRIGDDCTIWANAVLRKRTVLGDRVVLHSGVVLGTEGFGYRPSPDGRRILHIPHIGHVEIGDDVEIGANSAVDRGKFGPTRIGAQTKIDNLVQIGHNCRIGRGCMISGLAGIAGSVTLEDGVIIGGGAGLRDHITIGAGAKIAARRRSWTAFPRARHGAATRPSRTTTPCDEKLQFGRC